MQWTKDAKAMFAHKCAECHEGDMFPTGAFSFDKPFEMSPRCPLCDADMEPEPGVVWAIVFVWWFRFSRAFWFNLIVGFRPEKAAIAKDKK